jgi:hypothetical protein
MRFLKRLHSITIVGTLSMVFIGFQGTPAKSAGGEEPDANQQLQLLSGELRRDVAHLSVKIGERNVRNRPKELAASADWIEAQFKAAGFDVKRQEYQVAGVTCCNLQAEIPGTTKADEIVVVGAHYDTALGTAGANDNTTGVAATLALARRFSKIKPDRTLRFVAFVNEEPPYFQTEQMGSLVYARACKKRKEKIVAMLSLETIGYYSDEPGSQKYPKPLNLLYPSVGNFIGFIGNAKSAALVRQVTKTFRKNEKFPAESAALPEIVPGVGFSDQWAFWKEGYPALMVTDTAMFRYPYYHTPEDTIDKMDFERMARVVRGLEKVVAALSSPAGRE